MFRRGLRSVNYGSSDECVLGRAVHNSRDGNLPESDRPLRDAGPAHSPGRGILAKVLVIDDEPTIRTEIREVLERRGYEVSEAENGRMGLQAVETLSPDIVITDILMPEMDGIELVQILQRRDVPPKTIVMSSGGADGYLDYLDYAKKFGACTVIAKPMDLRELLGAVESLLAEA